MKVSPSASSMLWMVAILGWLPWLRLLLLSGSDVGVQCRQQEILRPCHPYREDGGSCNDLRVCRFPYGILTTMQSDGAWYSRGNNDFKNIILRYRYVNLWRIVISTRTFSHHLELPFCCLGRGTVWRFIGRAAIRCKCWLDTRTHSV